MTVESAVQTLAPSVDGVEQALNLARTAQERWSRTPIGQRLRVLRRIRHRIADDPRGLVAAILRCRVDANDAEVLASEVLPFLDALRFAEQHAERLLRSKKLGRSGRPLWLSGVALELHREPVGAILVISPSNYPLFLPGVQAMQALVAGNAVLIKPGSGGSDALVDLKRIAVQAGLDPDLLVVLDEHPLSATRAIEAGVDKLVVTGSAETGCEVLHAAADNLTPVTCELSGCDAVIALPGADTHLAARAIAFGLRLNNSQTCMRPHRIMAHHELAPQLFAQTIAAVSALRVRLSSAATVRLRRLIERAQADGAQLLCGHFAGPQLVAPFVFAGVQPTSALWRADIFAPVLAFASFEDGDEAIRLHNACPYGLTASIFGPEAEARKLASGLQVGTVLINDVIVPTADPRLPFSGRKRSGFGVTRGAEGLLEFTQLKAISVRRSPAPHLDAAHASDEAMFRGFIAATHAGSLRQRFKGATAAMKAAAYRLRKRTDQEHSA